jgi:hypothetical protein
MKSKHTPTRARAPRAAAVAGIGFSCLLGAAIVLLRLFLPADPAKPDAWLGISPGRLVLALDLVPFAGIAFLWFVGELRRGLDVLEDRFFSTLFLGSGLLFLAMLFAGAASLGAVVVAATAQTQHLMASETLVYAHALTANAVSAYATKMAAVFMIVTSTLALLTRFAPRWMAFLGYALALPLLFASRFLDWGLAVFPPWVLLVSLYILFDNLRQGSEAKAST